MNRTYHDSRLKFRAGVALRALALVGAGLGAAGLGAVPAYAQDLTAGAITGQVSDDAGAPIAGATVTLTSVNTGVKRTTTSSSSGGFRFSQIAPGSYDVVVTSSGKPSWTAQGVSVLASQSVSLDATLTGGDDIVVTGAAVAAFAGNTTGLNVDVENLVKTVPISRDLTSVVLLAPGTSKGDSAFGNLASIGGSSVAENAYYINGLNITNFDNYLGSSTVPFEFYKSVEVKSGGYPAEFGRATGGIINAVSKSGSNDFTAAAHVNWNPSFLHSYGKNLKSCDLSGTCTDLTNYKFDAGKTSSYQAILEAGLPIIKDRLFAYGLVLFQNSDSYSTNVIGGSTNRDKVNDPFYAIKIDAYPIDSQHLEFTLFDTRRTTLRQTYGYGVVNGNEQLGNIISSRNFYGGGVNFVGKYTGNFTDWLTISAAYGRMRDRFDSAGLDSASNGVYFNNASGTTLYGVQNTGFFTGQRTASTSYPYTTERKFYRADADILFSLFGDHHVRGGFDQEDNTLAHNTVRTGGDTLLSLGRISTAAYNAGNGGAGFVYIARANGIVEVNYFNTGGTFTATNRAFYLEDEWKLFDNRLTLSLGVRRDDFQVDKPDGSTFLENKGNYAPRIGFSFDILPDVSGKLFGSFSRYFLPLASNTAFRAAGSEYYIRERFYYSGLDSNNLPILTGQVTNLGSYQGSCPFNVTGSALSDGHHCNVTGDGSVKDPTYYLSKNLKATQETEWILGYEQKIGSWKASLSYTHRSLDHTTEDSSLDYAIYNYCKAQGLSDCPALSSLTGSTQFAIVNPGEDATIVVDPAWATYYGLNSLAGKTITIPGNLTGYPKAKRTYDAVTFTLDKPWNGKYSLGFNYTWSKAKGNSEGFVQSDYGQSDAGITADFDFPVFTNGSYGYLPTDRTHRFRLYGAVALSDNFTIGANFSLQSPRKFSCFGTAPATELFYGNYGNGYARYCGGVLVPRGTGLRSDWTQQTDLSFRYSIKVPTGQKLTLRADVFNLTNSQAVQQIDELGDLDVTGTPNPSYGQPTLYQTPRSVRLGFDITF